MCALALNLSFIIIIYFYANFVFFFFHLFQFNKESKAIQACFNGTLVQANSDNKAVSINYFTKLTSVDSGFKWEGDH